MFERRTETRMLCADLVEVRWKDPGGKARRAVANLEDISLSGACLQVDLKIPLGEIGYFVGLQFEDGCKWSTKAFKPMHLLDPRTLVKKHPDRAKGVRMSAPSSAQS